MPSRSSFGLPDDIAGIAARSGAVRYTAHHSAFDPPDEHDASASNPTSEARVDVRTRPTLGPNAEPRSDVRDQFGDGRDPLEVGTDVIVVRIDEDRMQPGGARSADVHRDRVTDVYDA